MPDGGAPLARLYLIAAVCTLFALLYTFLNLEPGPFMGLVLGTGPPLAVATWLATDAKRRKVGAAQDAGWLFYLTLPVSLPWYVWRTRTDQRWWFMIQLYALASAGVLGFLWGSLLRLVIDLLMRSAA